MTNLKRAIILLLMVAIFSNVRGQEFIHAKFYNIKYNSGTQSIDFSLKLKAGTNYESNSDEFGKWSALNIYFEFYLNGATITNSGSQTVNGNFTGNENDITQAAITGNVPLSQLLPATPTRAYNLVLDRNTAGVNDLKKDVYSYIATFSIPVSGPPAANTYFKLRIYDTNVGWTVNHSSWANAWDTQRRRPFSTEKQQYFLDPTCPPQALWTGTSDNDWNDSDNWVNPVDLTPVGVPCATTDVYISGTAPRFPILTGINRNVQPTKCKDITFFQGGQVGRIDLLDYERARVQLNTYSPYYQGGGADFTGGFWNYSYSYSTPPLANGEWHMLSMPLKGIVSGDLAYGGYPLTVMRKFNVMNSTSGRFTEGTWSTSFTETTEPFAAGEGFAFYVYAGGSNTGSVGFPYDYYSGWTGAPDHTGSHPAGGYGLGTTNGIIEFPTYDKADKLQSHRIQRYQGGVSTFYNVYTSGLASLLGTINYGNTTNTKVRDNSTGTNSDYKFIGDQGAPNTGVSYPVPQDWTGGEILIGNPFMSALDFDAFYAVNGHLGSYAMDTKAYKLWNGTQFVTYNCDTRTTSDGSTFTQYIAPMQGFFITHMGYTQSVNFDAAAMSKVSTGPLNLRSASGEEQNIIRLSVRGESGLTTTTMIGQLGNADAGYKVGEDVTKMFSSTQPIEKGGNDLNFSYIPEIYTSVGDVALDMNYIGTSGAIVPVGVRLPASGTSVLKLTGMNKYNADKIELLDQDGQVIADLTGRDSFEYSFANGAGDYQSGRFSLRIAAGTAGVTGWEEAATVSSAIQAYKSGDAIRVVSSSNDLIKQIRIYDVQGQILYSNTSVNADIYSVTEQFGKNQVLVVQVVTEKNTESIKLNN